MKRMVKSNIGEKSQSNQGIVPVFLPAALLLVLTGAVGTYNFVTSPAISRDANAGSSKGFNATEATFAQYVTAVKTLQWQDRNPLTRNEEIAALSEITRLVRAPISIDGNTFRDGKLSNFSPQTVLLSVSQCLARGAQRSAKNGDMDMARKYVDALYGIGDHVLSASSTSVRVLESAHHFLGFAAHIHAGVFGNTDYAGTAARYRESALTELWKERISPRIKGSHTYPGAGNERLFVAGLAKEYRDAWSLIRAGEV